jgi:hypothetical protein
MCLRSRSFKMGGEGAGIRRSLRGEMAGLGRCDDTETRRNGKPALYLAWACWSGFLHLSFVAFLPYQPKVSRDPATAGRGREIRECS